MPSIEADGFAVAVSITDLFDNTTVSVARTSDDITYSTILQVFLQALNGAGFSYITDLVAVTTVGGKSSLGASATGDSAEGLKDQARFDYTLPDPPLPHYPHEASFSVGDYVVDTSRPRLGVLHLEDVTEGPDNEFVVSSTSVSATSVHQVDCNYLAVSPASDDIGLADYVVCLNNTGYESLLEVGAVYLVTAHSGSLLDIRDGLGDYSAYTHRFRKVL